MGEAVSHKEYIVFWRYFSPYLALFRLFWASGAQDEGRTVELQWAGMLEKKETQEKKLTLHDYSAKQVNPDIHFVVGTGTTLIKIKTNLKDNNTSFYKLCKETFL